MFNDESPKTYTLRDNDMGKDSASGRPSCRVIVCSQLFAVFMFAVGITGGILIGVYLGRNDSNSKQCDPQSSVTTLPDSTKVTTTPRHGPVTPRDDAQECPKYRTEEKPSKGWGMYAPLTGDEMERVHGYLMREGLISPRDEPVTLMKNYPLYMYLHPYRKAEALSYLDKDGTRPGRFAKVHVIRGSRQNPDVMEYKVGPLENITMTARALLLDGEVHFNSRPYDYFEVAFYEQFLISDFQKLSTLTMESFDGAFYPDGGLNLFHFLGPPGALEKERQVRFVIFFQATDNFYDFTLFDFLPLSGTIEANSNNMSEWRTHSYYYLNQGPFETVDDLVAAYGNNSIRKISIPSGYRNTVRGRVLPKRDDSLPYRQHAKTPPPRTYEPGGARYSVNGHSIKWMGWSFEISAGQLRGPSVFNIKFKGQRIVYEMSLNDINLIYATDNSGQNNVVYADAIYGVGEYRGIVPGVDCPEHATLLDTTYWDPYAAKAVTAKSICIFEEDGQGALWRRKATTYDTGLRNHVLIVRMTSTIGNYDYIVDFQFVLDGKIETVVAATGLIQGAFWDAENPNIGPDKSRDAFGYRLSDQSTGGIHDHMFGFKVDMDILDANNSFEIINWKAGSVVDALKTQNPSASKKPPYFIYNETRYIEWETLQREAGFRINLDQPKFWLVVNENQRNKWGAKRGYQILPHATGSQILSDTYPAMQALSFSKYHCAVTKRKDEEQYLTSVYDVNRLDNTKGDLEKMLDNEYIVNDDIVNWVTVGFLHVPVAEDVPMTTRIKTGFTLKPFNFFDRTATFDMPQYTDTEGNMLTERPPDFEQCLEQKVKTCTFC